VRAILLAALLALGCSRDAEHNGAASATPVPPPLPPLPDLTDMPSPSGTATPGIDGGKPCGAFGMPDCPLQGWMRQNMNPPMKAKDWQGMADALERAALLVPPDYVDGSADGRTSQTPKNGYANWVSIARDGANAARAAELDAVKAACRGCHEQYKKKYRKEMRLRPLPALTP
jgi:hypothetical protein